MTDKYSNDDIEKMKKMINSSFDEVDSKLKELQKEIDEKRRSIAESEVFEELKTPQNDELEYTPPKGVPTITTGPFVLPDRKSDENETEE